MIRVPDPTTSEATMSTPRDAILGLVEAADAATAGRKAAGLGALLGKDLQVPDGFVVTDAADLSSPDVIDEIASRLAALDGAVAVRSSSTVEDLDEASFAGMYETVLRVAGVDAVITAIEQVSGH